MTASSFVFTDAYRPVCHVYTGDEWLDVSCFAHEAEIQRGRERFTDRFDPATATMTFDNRTGWADMAGDANDVLASPLRPARHIRMGIEGPWDLPVWDHADYILWLFYGYIDTTRPTYDPVQEDVVTINAVDALAEVGRVTLESLADPGVGSGEVANLRVDRILDAAAWPYGRTLYASATTLLPTTLGSQTIDELGRTSDSAGGVVYGDLEGGITYKDRDWMIWVGGTDPDGIIGYSPDTATTDACPTDWETHFDRGQLTTQVEIGRKVTPSELPTLYTDPSAIADYGTETLSRTDLLCSDPATMFPILADRWIAIRGVNSMPRIEAVTFNASTMRQRGPFITWGDVVDEFATWTDFMAATPTWGDLLLGIQDPMIRLMGTCMPELPSRYQCRLTTKSGRLVFDRMMFATGVRHFISRNEWEMRVTLDGAEWAATEEPAD